MKRILSLVMVFIVALSSMSFGASSASTKFKSVNEVYGVYMDTYNYCYYVVDKNGAKSYTKIYGTNQFYKPVASSEPQSKWLTKDKKTIEIYFGKRSNLDSTVMTFSKDAKGKIQVRCDDAYGFSLEFKKFKSEAELKQYYATSQSFKNKIKAEASELKAEADKTALAAKRKAEAPQLLSDKTPLLGQFINEKGYIISFDDLNHISLSAGGTTISFERQKTNGQESPNQYGYYDYAQGKDLISVTYVDYEDNDHRNLNLSLDYNPKTNTFKVNEISTSPTFEKTSFDGVFKKM